MSNFFQGLYTAIPTPFKDYKIDFESLEKIIKFQIKAKVSGIVVSGSTGESTSLDEEEYHELISAAVKIANKKIQVIAGAGVGNTNKTIQYSKAAEESGADALLLVTPFYSKPTANGIINHFTEVHNVTTIPIMLYSVPSRTSIDMDDNTIVTLSELPRILGLKDSAEKLERPLRILSKVKKEFSLISGDDSTATAFNSMGGVGCVSVASNIAPDLCKMVQDLTKKNDFHNAIRIQQLLLPLYKAMFIETNPAPVKYALSIMNFCSEEVRMPLCAMEQPSKNTVESVINYINNISNDG